MFYQFGPYRLDSDERQLWRDGAPVQLTPKSFELLLALVESGGKLVRKQDLMEKVWPGTFIEDANLAQNIATIRRALGDQSKDPQFILTVPKQGYRFVTEVVAYRSLNEFAQSKQRPTSGDVWRKLRILLVLALALAAAVAWKLSRPEQPTAMPRPITSMPGMEIHPSFSRDGTQVVFSWIEAAGSRPQLYLSDVSADRSPVRLTTSEAADVYPAWSPDGRMIAFLRNPGENGEVHVVSPTGYVTRKIAHTRENVLAWWPDSHSVVTSERDSADTPASLFRVSVSSGEATKITFPTEGVGDVGAALSPDGRRMAVTRWTSGGQYEILVGDLETLAFQAVIRHSTPIFGVTWAPDGKDLIFSATRDSVPKLWRIPSTAIPGKPPERVAYIEGTALFPVVFTPPGSYTGRLVYSQMHQDVNIRRWNFPADASSSAKPTTIQIAPSTLQELDPAFSPDGKRIAFASDRSGSTEIWMCGGDGSNPNQLTRFGAGAAGSPRWSPDGKKIAFDYSHDGQSSIHSMNEDGSGLIRLATGHYQAARPSWSLDAATIYFQCAAPAGREICRIPAGGGAPVQVTTAGGADAFESRDGWLYFVKSVDQPGLWRIPVAGGPETLFHKEVRQGYWSAGNDSIYYIRTATSLAPHTLKAVHLVTGQSRDITTIMAPLVQFTPGFSITPDGRSMLLVQADTRESDLMIVENFR